MTLDQSGCFGTCPVYALTVGADGAATYTGRRYTDYPGPHLAQLDAARTDRVGAAVARVLAQADTLPREIESGITDVSTSRIHIVRMGGDTLSFRGTTEYAQPVAALREALFAVADSTRWRRDPSAPPLPPHRLRVTLQAADQAQPLTEDFFFQRLRVDSMLSQNPPVFLLTFDPGTLSAEQMVDELRRKTAVVDVEVYGVEAAGE